MKPLIEMTLPELLARREELLEEKRKCFRRIKLINKVIEAESRRNQGAPNDHTKQN